MSYHPIQQTGNQTATGSHNAATTQLEISVSCTDLRDKDAFSKSDPLCVMFHQSEGGQWAEVGRTEMLVNTLNPSWKSKFIVDYRFQERQLVKFEVYDWDTNSHSLKKHDFLAKIECSLGNVVSTKGKQFVSMASGPSKHAKFIICAEEVSGCNDIVKMQLIANKLDDKDKFGKSDPYYVVSKIMAGGQWSVVAKSEYIKNTLNPTWKLMTMPVRELCNGDYDRQLKFDVYDWDDRGQHDLIGSFTTSLKTLQASQGRGNPFPCINPKKTSKKKYVDSGTSINFSVAVDFTASNGEPHKPGSLHYRGNEFGENQYTTAIKAVGEIIQDYDSDKQFPALGFGAKIPPHGQVSHEFFLNLRQDSPYCSGVAGILQAYFTSLQHVTLYGPTNFAPVINHVAKFANSFQDGRQYFVLLIITDGVITDMAETKQAIVAASNLPLSIIIVGVGNEDFRAMEALDSDKQALKSGQDVASRDIVQFVELRKFFVAQSYNRERLAQQVLAEVPKQLVSWMTKRGVKPLYA